MRHRDTWRTPIVPAGRGDLAASARARGGMTDALVRALLDRLELAEPSAAVCCADIRAHLLDEPDGAPVCALPLRPLHGGGAPPVGLWRRAADGSVVLLVIDVAGTAVGAAVLPPPALLGDVGARRYFGVSEEHVSARTPPAGLVRGARRAEPGASREEIFSDDELRGAQLLVHPPAGGLLRLRLRLLGGGEGAKSTHLARTHFMCSLRRLCCLPPSHAAHNDAAAALDDCVRAPSERAAATRAAALCRLIAPTCRDRAEMCRDRAEMAAVAADLRAALLVITSAPLAASNGAGANGAANGAGANGAANGAADGSANGSAMSATRPLDGRKGDHSHGDTHAASGAARCHFNGESCGTHAHAAAGRLRHAGSLISRALKAAGARLAGDLNAAEEAPNSNGDEGAESAGDLNGEQRGGLGGVCARLGELLGCRADEFAARPDERSVVFVAAEVGDWCRVGGLAKTVGHISAALGALGDLTTYVIAPAYAECAATWTPRVRPGGAIFELDVPLGDFTPQIAEESAETERVSVLEADGVGDGDVRVLLLHAPRRFVAPCVGPCEHTPIHSLTRSLAHSLTHPLTCSLITIHTPANYNPNSRRLIQVRMPRRADSAHRRSSPRPGIAAADGTAPPRRCGGRDE